MESMGPIGVYGATGYTGKLVARELLAAGRDVVLSARSADKLDALAQELGGGPSVRVAPAALDDPAALRAAFTGLHALVNCAGPFVRCGAPVLDAAIATGAHYVDTTGDQPWIKRVFDEFDAPARAAGVTAVPGMGFDDAPADLLAALVDGPLQPLRSLTVSYALEGFQATRGTMRSALEQLGGEELVYADGRWSRAPLWGPIGERSDDPRLGCHRVARYPGGEIVMVPHHLDVRAVVVRIDAATFAPHPRLAVLVPVLTPLVALACAPRCATWSTARSAGCPPGRRRTRAAACGGRRPCTRSPTTGARPGGSSTAPTSTA
jgi:short subunit dehydrogenase-like uncharacterized protein